MENVKPLSATLENPYPTYYDSTSYIFSSVNIKYLVHFTILYVVRGYCH